jgi:hypothetical protein
MAEHPTAGDTVSVAKARRVDGRPARAALAEPADPQGSSPLRMFRFERRWLLRIFEAVLPSGADPRLRLGAADVPLGAFVDDLLARAPLLSVVGLRAGVWLVMLAPLFVLGRARSFLGLSPDQRTELLDRLRGNRAYMVREIPNLMKITALLGFGGLAAVQESVGMPPLDRTPPWWARRDGP